MYSSFFLNDTATTEIYTLSLHDALPISTSYRCRRKRWRLRLDGGGESELRRHREPLVIGDRRTTSVKAERSEEHTSELQSPDHLVCRLLLEKKNKDQRRANRNIVGESVR